MSYLNIAFYDVETWTLRKIDQKYTENGAREVGRRSAGPIGWKIKCYKKSRRKELFYIQWSEGRLTGLGINCPLKHTVEGRI